LREHGTEAEPERLPPRATRGVPRQRALDSLVQADPGLTGELAEAPPDVPAHIEERDGFSVIVPEQPMASLNVAEARTAIERVRR
jgi:hypothetical protein